MSKHTPGPWTPARNPSSLTARGIDGPRGRRIVKWGGLASPMSHESQANAELIAAAPDLLSAVTLLLANIDTCGLDIDPAYRATAIKARNKALGRTDPPKAA